MTVQSHNPGSCPFVMSQRAPTPLLIEWLHPLQDSLSLCPFSQTRSHQAPRLGQEFIVLQSPKLKKPVLIRDWLHLHKSADWRRRGDRKRCHHGCSLAASSLRRWRWPAESRDLQQQRRSHFGSRIHNRTQKQDSQLRPARRHQSQQDARSWNGVSARRKTKEKKKKKKKVELKIRKNNCPTAKRWARQSEMRSLAAHLRLQFQSCWMLDWLALFVYKGEKPEGRFIFGEQGEV